MRRLAAVLVVLFLPAPLPAQEPAPDFEPAGALQSYVVDTFSGQIQDGLPRGWKQLFFRKIPVHTTYTVVQEADNYVVMAVSSASASAIVKEVPVPLKAFPILSWRWKVERTLRKADARSKKGDDYPARIYIAFKYDPSKASPWMRAKYGLGKALYGEYPPHAALNYIWDNKLPVGTALDNAYTDRVKMVVVETGDAKAGRWVVERRNVYEDYRNLYGEEPPELQFVALMTDTDNTGESATAWYDDLIFLAAPLSPSLRPPE